MRPVLATGVLWVMSTVTTPERFQAWAWRVPFLCSVILIVLGYVIRRAVEESLVFKEMLQRKRASSGPLRDLFPRNANRSCPSHWSSPATTWRATS